MRRIQNPALQTAAAVLAVMAVASVFWSLNLGEEPLWQDERYSETATRMSLRRLVDPEVDPAHPPTYSLLLSAWRQIGDSDAWLRGMSVLFAVATLPVVYSIGRTLGGVRVGVLAMALFVTVPQVYAHAGEARSYAATLFFAALATWSALQIVRGSEGMPPWRLTALHAGLAMSGALLLGMHHGAWFWFPFVLASCLLAVLPRRNQLLTLVGMTVLGRLVYAGVFLPYLIAGLQKAHFTMPVNAIHRTIALTVSYLGGGSYMPLAAVALLAGSGWAGALWLRGRDWNTAMLAVAAVFAPVTLLVAVTLLDPGFTNHPKFLICIFPMYCAATACGIAGMKKLWMASALSFLIVCNLVGIGFVLSGDLAPPWKQAAKIIGEQRIAGHDQIAVLCGLGVYSNGAPYLASEFLSVRDYGEDPKTQFADINDLPSYYDDIWLVKHDWNVNEPDYDNCPAPASWGGVDDTRALEYDRNHLWRAISNRDKEHALNLERYVQHQNAGPKCGSANSCSIRWSTLTGAPAGPPDRPCPAQAGRASRIPCRAPVRVE